jgi:hypothetical protein
VSAIGVKGWAMAQITTTLPDELSEQLQQLGDRLPT